MFAILLSSWIALAAPPILHSASTPVDGTYVKSCFTVSDDTLESTLTLLQGFWNFSHVAYEDSQCKTAYLIYSVSYRARLQETNLDLTAVEASYTPLTDQVSRALNQISYCGVNNWKTNLREVVTGRVCEDFHTPNSGEVLYTILKSDTTTQEIFIGEPTSQKDGHAPSQRFEKLEGQAYQKKVSHTFQRYHIPFSEVFASSGVGE